MEVYKLLCKKRDLSQKAKKIRESGFVPATVYGHNIEPISIQIDHIDVLKFMKAQSMGSQVLLDIEGKEQLAIFKESQRETLTYKTIHMDFQALTTGEKIKVNVPIIYLNKESVGKDEVLQEQMNEIEILALPKHLIDHVDVDVSKYKLGDSVLVSDLDITKDKNIEIMSPMESQVCVITHGAKFVEETVDDDAVVVPAVAEEAAAE
ncbi:MAG: 50S ribosomal protein L25 [Eubacteriales bacterium]